jgi:hypothetical protein
MHCDSICPCGLFMDTRPLNLLLAAKSSAAVPWCALGHPTHMCDVVSKKPCPLIYGRNLAHMPVILSKGDI